MVPDVINTQNYDYTLNQYDAFASLTAVSEVINTQHCNHSQSIIQDKFDTLDTNLQAVTIELHRLTCM